MLIRIRVLAENTGIKMRSRRGSEGQLLNLYQVSAIELKQTKVVVD